MKNWIEVHRMKANLLLVALVHNFIAVVFTQSCADEIVKISEAGRIRASTISATTGETVIVTCSSKCAWNWHTIIVDGDIVDSRAASETSKDFRLSVENNIINCQSCKEPDEIDCNDSSQGPIQSVLNISFLIAGAHYVQCVAHLFESDSQLWPNNRIISIPSRTLKIDVIDTGSESTSSSVLQSTADRQISSLMQLHASPVKNSNMQSSKAPSECIHHSLSTIISDSNEITQELETATMLVSRISITETKLYSLTESQELQSSLFNEPSFTPTIRKNLLSSPFKDDNDDNSHLKTPTLNLKPESWHTSFSSGHILRQTTTGSQLSCEFVNTENTVVLAVISILVIMSLSLIAAIVVLMYINKKSTAMYHKLCLSLKKNGISIDEVKKK